MTKKSILTAENRACGIAITLNGVYKGTYFGRITATTDATAMVRSWLGENGIRFNIIRTYLLPTGFGHTLYAELSR